MSLFEADISDSEDGEDEALGTDTAGLPSCVLRILRVNQDDSAVSDRYKILVAVGTLFQFDRDSGGLVLFLSSGHVFGTGDVLVVCNTAVLVHLQEKVVVDCLYLVFLADIAAEQSCIEVRGGLVLVITAPVQIVDVEAKCQLLVDVDGEVGLEAFFTVHFVAGLVVG